MEGSNVNRFAEPPAVSITKTSALPATVAEYTIFLASGDHEPGDGSRTSPDTLRRTVPSISEVQSCEGRPVTNAKLRPSGENGPGASSPLDAAKGRTA